MSEGAFLAAVLLAGGQECAEDRAGLCVLHDHPGGSQGQQRPERK